MKKIVINEDFGGFGLSEKATEKLFALKNWKLVKQDTVHGFTLFYKDSIEDRNLFYEYELERDDPLLIKVVEELGNQANSRYSSLKVVEIPDDVEWLVEEYDGREWVAEKHRSWS